MNEKSRIYNFCTLFDTGYLARGLALYYSLESICFNFRLYIFAFDENSFQILNGLKLKNATIISLSELEDTKLLQVKFHRTKAEYCWTSTSSTILYCLNNFQIDDCTYLDADLYFLSSPESIFSEIGDASIALTMHNYTLKYDQSTTSGKYCVQFVFFRNDTEGLKALNWWRDSCLDWCFARLEDGKFGDQKYLDDWTTRFNNVCVIKNLGAGVAPWNIQQYTIISQENKNLHLIDNSNGLSFSVIFYHFHGLQYNVENQYVVVMPSRFELSREVQQNFYSPYINKLLQIAESYILNEEPVSYTIIFKNNSLLIKCYLSIRLILKRHKIFQTINSMLVKSSCP